MYPTQICAYNFYAHLDVSMQRFFNAMFQNAAVIAMQRFDFKNSIIAIK